MIVECWGSGQENVECLKGLTEQKIPEGDG